MASYFRCYRCNPPQGVEFAVNGDPREAKCPQCGASGLAVVKLALHHFIFPAADGIIPGANGLRYHKACALGKPLQNYGHAKPDMVTPEPEVVNCPECRQTDVFKAAQKEWDAWGGGLKIDGVAGCCG